MKYKVKTWLEDVRIAILQIEKFLPANRDFNEFENDLKTKKAIERNIVLIGESIRRILIEQPQFSITDANKFVDIRNRIIFGYEKVSNEVIWTIASKDLDTLLKEVEELLQDTETNN